MTRVAAIPRTLTRTTAAPLPAYPAHVTMRVTPTPLRSSRSSRASTLRSSSARQGLYPRPLLQQPQPPRHPPQARLRCPLSCPHPSSLPPCLLSRYLQQVRWLSSSQEHRGCPHLIPHCKACLSHLLPLKPALSPCCLHYMAPCYPWATLCMEGHYTCPTLTLYLLSPSQWVSLKSPLQLSWVRPKPPPCLNNSDLTPLHPSPSPPHRAAASLPESSLSHLHHCLCPTSNLHQPPPSHKCQTLNHTSILATPHSRRCLPTCPLRPPWSPSVLYPHIILPPPIHHPFSSCLKTSSFNLHPCNLQCSPSPKIFQRQEVKFPLRLLRSLPLPPPHTHRLLSPRFLLILSCQAALPYCHPALWRAQCLHCSNHPPPYPCPCLHQSPCPVRDPPLCHLYKLKKSLWMRRRSQRVLHHHRGVLRLHPPSSTLPVTPASQHGKQNYIYKTTFFITKNKKHI